MQVVIREVIENTKQRGGGPCSMMHWNRQGEPNTPARTSQEGMCRKEGRPHQGQVGDYPFPPTLQKGGIEMRAVVDIAS